MKYAILPDYKLNSAGLGLRERGPTNSLPFGLYYTLLGREDNDQTNYLALALNK